MRHHPVPHDDLAAAIRPDALPEAWAASLSAIISKLRVALEKVGLGRDDAITSAFRCYQVHLPDGAWVDLEVAASSLQPCVTPRNSSRWSHSARAVTAS